MSARFLGTCALLAELAFIGIPNAHSQGIPVHAEGLTEELISVELDNNRKQQGVLSIKTGTRDQTKLAVLLPGYPSVLRPVVENNVMQRSRLTGNFLIRARRHLADASIALLLVDCHSASGDYCSSSYQASRSRQQDVQKLIQVARSRLPSIKEVWLIGTSMGTVSSSFMTKFGENEYSGAIHTASITEPYARNSYRELADFDYASTKIPQFLIHHQADPCELTTYSGAKRISEKFSIPLITVRGGGDFQGAACDAFTEHGFRGKEIKVMGTIMQIIKTGTVSESDI